MKAKLTPHGSRGVALQVNTFFHYVLCKSNFICFIVKAFCWVCVEIDTSLLCQTNYFVLKSLICL